VVGGLFAYVVELVTEDVDAFAVVVDDVETTLCVTSWVSVEGVETRLTLRTVQSI